MLALRQLVHEVHRRSLWQVLGIYAVASWVIYQVVLALFEGIGLPGWVPGTALVLLLIGLPIVLATAFVQEGAPGLSGGGEEAMGDGGAAGGRASGRAGAAGAASIEGLESSADAVAARARSAPDAAASSAAPGAEPATEPAPDTRHWIPESRGRRPLFTWNRAITGGVLAFAGLGVAASGFMGMRTMGIGPAATLISSGQLEDRAPVVLADFESLTGDAVLARVVTEAFRADLAQSPAIDLTTPQDVASVLERMDRSGTEPLNAATAREVAARSGTKAIVVGDIGQIGGRYVLSARIIGALDGEVLVTEKATAVDSTELVSAIDQLAKSIREEIGESLRSIRRSPYLSAITTPSLPALKKLVQAYEASNRGEEDRALALLGEAIQLDSTFSEAHRKRSAILFNQGRTGEGLQAIEAALAHPDRLTDYERYHARALRAIYRGELRPAVNEYRALLELDSADSRALNNLGNTYFFLGNWERMADALRKSLHVQGQGPNSSVYSPSYRLLAAAEWNRGLPDRAAAVIAEVEALDSGLSVLPQARALLAGAGGDFETAEAEARRLLDEHPGTTAQLNGLGLLAGPLATRGRIEASLQEVAQAVEILEEVGGIPGAFGWSLSEVVLAAVVLQDTARAERALQRVLERYEPASLEPPPFQDLVRAYALVGKLDSARAMLERLRAQPEWIHGPDRWVVPAAEADVALAEKDHAAARRFFRTAREARPNCPSCYLPQIGVTFEYQAERDSAIAVYEEYLEVPDAFRANGGNRDILYRAFTLERLGALHEQAGRRAEAARYYAGFVELWEDADPELQPRVQSARRALARLTAEGR